MPVDKVKKQSISRVRVCVCVYYTCCALILPLTSPQVGCESVVSPHYEGAVLLACRSSTSLTLWSELPPQPAKEGVLSVSITIGSMEMSLSASKNNFIYSTNRSIPIVRSVLLFLLLFLLL